MQYKKIKTLLIVAAVIAMLVVPISAADEIAQSPWPKEGYDNQNTGQSQYLGVQNYSLKWSKTLKGGEVLAIGSSPIIGPDGTIYFVGAFCDKKRSYGNFYAIKPDGTVKWNKTFKDGKTCRIDISPSIGPNQVLYVTVNYEDGKKQFSKLYVINPDGKVKWSYTLKDRVTYSPTIAPDGTVYVGCCFKNKGGWFTNFYALNSNGAFKWNRTVIERPDIYVGGFHPAIGYDGTIYFAGKVKNGNSWSSRVYALNPRGVVKWSKTINGKNSMAVNSPSIGPDGTVYIGSTYNEKGKAIINFYAFKSDGSVKWNKKITEKGNSFLMGDQAIAADGTIYFGSVYFKGKTQFSNFYALKPDGSVKWNKSELNNGIWATPTIGKDGTVYFANGYGTEGRYYAKLMALNPNGTVKWSYVLRMGETFLDISPMVISADGTMYFTGRYGKHLKEYGYIYAIKNK